MEWLIDEETGREYSIDQEGNKIFKDSQPKKIDSGSLMGAASGLLQMGADTFAGSKTNTSNDASTFENAYKQLDDANEQSQKNQLKTLGTRTAQGASIGTQIMPGWGTLIGGAVGGLWGGIEGGINRSKDKREIESNKDQALERSRQTQDQAYKSWLNSRMMYAKGGSMILPDEFSHETNPIDIVKDGVKIGEATGQELIMNPEQTNKAINGTPEEAQKAVKEAVANGEKQVEREGGGLTEEYNIPLRNGVRKNEDGSESTHLMAREYIDGKWKAFPTLFQNEDNSWVEYNPNSLDEKGNPIGWRKAYDEAVKRGEVNEFENEDEAILFADYGSWKNPDNMKPRALDTSINPDTSIPEQPVSLPQETPQGEYNASLSPMDYESDTDKLLKDSNRKAILDHTLNAVSGVQNLLTPSSRDLTVDKVQLDKVDLETEAREQQMRKEKERSLMAARYRARGLDPGKANLLMTDYDLQANDRINAQIEGLEAKEEMANTDIANREKLINAQNAQRVQAMNAQKDAQETARRSAMLTQNLGNVSEIERQRMQDKRDIGMAGDYYAESNLNDEFSRMSSDPNHPDRAWYDQWLQNNPGGDVNQAIREYKLAKRRV